MKVPFIWNPRASHTHQKSVVYKTLKSPSSESLFTSLQNTKFKQCDQIQTKIYCIKPVITLECKNTRRNKIEILQAPLPLTILEEFPFNGKQRE